MNTHLFIRITYGYLIALMIMVSANAGTNHPVEASTNATSVSASSSALTSGTSSDFACIIGAAAVGITVVVASEAKESKASVESLEADLASDDVDTLLAKAEKGSLAAYNELGERYEFAKGVPWDEKKALTYYTKASGLGVIYDYDAAQRKYVFQRESCLKFPQAGKIKPCSAGLRNYARCLLHGTGGCNITPGPALCHLQAAYEAGDTDSLLYLFYCYDNKFGVYSDSSKKLAEAKAAQYKQLADATLDHARIPVFIDYLKQYKFGQFLQKCTYCDNDFIKINGSKRVDFVELVKGRLVHKGCVKEPAV